MKSVVWFVLGLAGGFVAAHLVNKDPRGHEVLAEVHDAAAAQEVREILHRRKVCKRQYSRHK